jgi:aerobic carbon-monoxide dehydrogenase medium subunit
MATEGQPVKAAPFEYHAPDTLEEAVTLLAEFGDEAKVLAGGQSLVPMLALRLARVEQLIDLNRIPSLRYVSALDGFTRVGAMTTQATIASSGELRQRMPLLAEATAHIGHFQIRNRGTIGGSLSHADPAAEYPAVAVALDAEIDLASVRGTRTVRATEFFTGSFTTAAEPDEVLTEVRFGPGTSGASGASGFGPGASGFGADGASGASGFGAGASGWAVVELARRHGDFAIAGVACTVSLDAADRIGSLRLGLFGVASTPVRAFSAEREARGLAADDVDPVAVGHAALSEVSCVSDVHADADYRRRVGAHLAGQAVAQAVRKARAIREARRG